MNAEELAATKARTEGRWTVLAERLLEKALSELRSGDDTTVATASAALAALTACDLSADEQDELWHELAESDEVPCTCPPDLVARGGFTSNCPAHGKGGAS
jgi:hypothetical protein